MRAASLLSLSLSLLSGVVNAAQCTLGSDDGKCAFLDDEAAGEARASTVQVDVNEAGVFDAVGVRYQAKLRKIAGTYAAWGIGLFESTSNTLVERIYVKDERLIAWEQQQQLVRDAYERYEEMIPYVGCRVVNEWETSEEGCNFGSHWPKLVSMVATEGYGDGASITVMFDRETDMPDVESDQAIRNVIVFSASIGQELSGQWIDPKTLKINIVDSTGHSDYHNEPVTARIGMRERRPSERLYSSLATLEGSHESDILVKGVVSVRIGFEGTFHVALFTLDETEPACVSEPFDINAISQQETTIVIGRNSVSQGDNRLKPIWSLKPKVVMTGSRLKLPRVLNKARVAQADHQLFDGDAWSISFWLAIAPKAYSSRCSTVDNTHFRALLYHGAGKGHERGARTPSVWLFPGSNTLALRVSTVESSDFGINSKKQLTEGKWVHLAMTFENTTSENGSPRYKAKIFADGECILDFEESEHVVLATHGSLHFGHDAWTNGPEGFVQNIDVFDHRLDKFDIRQLKRRSGVLLAKETEFPWNKNDDIGSCKPVDHVLADELYEKASEDPTSNKNLLEMAASDGHTPSMFLLSTLDKRFSQPAANQLKRAAISGHGEAMYTLGIWMRLAPLLGLEFSNEGNSTEWLERAALHGSVPAKLTLANDFYRLGHCRAATFYYSQVADEAFREHTAGGTEPLIELQQLSDFVKETGERGDEDEAIQYQMMKADQGDADAMVNMGSLYYYGARGLDRDQPRAYRYFERAAAQGHPVAQTACGNMWLKGEGVNEVNRTKALDYYLQAAAQDNLEALNGLGFIYFFGHGPIEKNVTKALEYFERNLRDGDSLNNAAHIYIHDEEHRDVNQAIEYLEMAAKQYGSFGASKNLGDILLKRATTLVQCKEAATYLRVAALKGSWAGKLRQGFDAFLDRDMEAAAISYLEAAYMGYSRGAENAIWLLHEQLGVLKDPNHILFSMIDTPIPPLQMVYKGDMYNDLGNSEKAIESWVSASIDGDLSIQPVYRSRASFNLGVQAMHDSDWERATFYFRRARKFLDDNDSEPAQAAMVALNLAEWRLKAAKYLDYMGLARYSSYL
uniref:Uncharacterized protein n=1 Tax=Mucochytrium quahogii TaxID=96639 RepID=A0A7S2WID4_9STRA|mmetsp:Transcript_32268/g.51463  ORF Transcript_32268/g.51463 Transcript_32268/m.51463 type:complete len:1082 (+) Transcript_32268:129-3374(+)|eukprot:CAMPEP_0203762298 /NCGR_PEP_ID=MMETSP0098-20131031/15216_1 /ASSEMBLY_ACC=CAM_ASM_000208 /TAXON_ID=96639 /ORGANISM=" , Strain NY0313808BC1" /LENGTH=1081 /DNA_ID=CAMNT_0050656657 /DNA_START=47 /DNA_END=3292 /DNA_ORIENTATION=-